MDVTDYLKTYKFSPRELVSKIILDVLATTGITATAGIGTNLYLCKIAWTLAQSMTGPCDDIIHLPHHVSATGELKKLTTTPMHL